MEIDGNQDLEEVQDLEEMEIEEILDLEEMEIDGNQELKVDLGVKDNIRQKGQLTDDAGNLF
jgi:hypothetical protein